MENIRTVFCDMPNSIKGFTIATNDGYFTIVLNGKLSYEQHLESYHHEMTHIENGDYDKKSNVGLIEMFCHRLDK